MALTLGREEIAKLRREGATMERTDGKGLLEAEKVEQEYLTILREIRDKIAKAIDRPQPTINVPAPQVTVTPPETKRPRKWKHVLKKDSKGRTTEIISEAIE